MVLISWCLRTKDGLALVEPRQNVADSYMQMAEESISFLAGVEKSDIWTATMSYYIFYYSLYALMQRIGVKCEIHSCSLEFMRQFLADFYSEEDIEMIGSAFSARNDLQYYADRPVDKEKITEIRAGCKDFFLKTKRIISTIREEQVNEIRDKLSKLSEKRA